MNDNTAGTIVVVGFFAMLAFIVVGGIWIMWPHPTTSTQTASATTISAPQHICFKSCN